MVKFQNHVFIGFKIIGFAVRYPFSPLTSVKEQNEHILLIFLDKNPHTGIEMTNTFLEYNTFSCIFWLKKLNFISD